MKRLLAVLLIINFIFPCMFFNYGIKTEAAGKRSGISAYYNDDDEMVYDLTACESLNKNFALVLYLVLDDAWLRYLNDPTMCFRIIVPEGTYYIKENTKSIRFGSNVTLELNGSTLVCEEDGVIFQTQPRPTTKRDTISVPDGVGRYDDYENIKIVDGTIDMNNNQRVPLRFAHVSGLTLENLTIKNSSAPHMVEISACKDVYVSECTFMDSKRKEDSTTMPLEAFQIDVANRETMSYSKDPVYDDYPCDNVEITHCTFRNLYRGFGSHTVIPDVYQNNIRVHDCSFIDIQNAAIMCSMWKNSHIYNNEYVNVGKETDDNAYEWYTHLPSSQQNVR